MKYILFSNKRVSSAYSLFFATLFPRSIRITAFPRLVTSWTIAAILTQECWGAGRRKSTTNIAMCYWCSQSTKLTAFLSVQRSLIPLTLQSFWLLECWSRMKRGGREGIIFKGVMSSAEQTIQMWAGFQRGVLMDEGCLLRSLCGMRLWAKCEPFIHSRGKQGCWGCLQ